MGLKLVHHRADVFLLGVAIALTKAPSAEVDHDAHVELVHFGFELIYFGLVDSALMAVDVDKWKLGACYRMLGHLERGGWIVFFKAHFLSHAQTCSQANSQDDAG